MVKVETYFTVFDGRASYPNIERFRDAVKGLPDGTYTHRIEKLYNRRSNPQNRYYWAVVLPLVRDGLHHVGYLCETVDEAHEFCKREFATIQGKKRKRLVNRNTGEVRYIKVYPSTRKLTTVEFNAYFEKIIMWAAEFLDVQIPYPREVIKEPCETQNT